MKTIILCIFISVTLCSCSFNPAKLTRGSSENSAAAEINAKLSLAYLTQRDTFRAKQKLLLAQHQAPHNPAVWYITGYFLETTGSSTAAEQAYLHAIRLAPPCGAPHNNYGAFLCRHKQYTKAIQQFLLAINDPDYLAVASAYENAAQCALKIPDQVLANKFFNLARTAGADL